MTATRPTEAWPITLSNLSVRYPNGTLGLDDVSLTINPGEMVAVIGLSGSGKSTLIRTINGLVTPTSGVIQVGPYDITAAKGRQLRKIRGHIGMIFQGFNLADRATVFQNVRVGRLAHTPTWKSILGISSREDKAIIADALNKVGILDQTWKKAGALSGGQKQRVAIARTLAQQPSLILADEPVASLDPPTAHAVMADLQRINQQQGITILVNLHLIDLAQQYTTRIIGLRKGKVVFDGPAAGSTLANFEEIYGRKIQPDESLGSIE
ncbi:phosphonate ABC transporter ATP-binding protein [Corynebacterium sp. H127]|uniref:phosphonate ABC transporter ATP-binding protein n=1 Tax=Corynebacterium sp. H127 TaxID=3133418 RepID=UPI0030B1A852